jgi:hypothetical protein
VGVRTCDFRFIRRGSQPIELPLGDILLGMCLLIKAYIFIFIIIKSGQVAQAGFF